jgi:Protein of unknown function DUF58
MKFTPRGQLLFAASIGLLFSLLLFHEDPFIDSAFLIVLALLVSDLLWVFVVTKDPRRWFKLTPESQPTTNISVGVPSALTFSLRKKARGKITLSAGELGDVAHLTPSEMDYASAVKELKLDFATPFAGEYKLSKLGIDVVGPLSLFRGVCSVRVSAEFAVYPKVATAALESLALLGRIGIGEVPINTPGIGTEFYDIRKYAPGDDYRQINWKATARVGDLIVNERLREVGTRYYIILEAYSPNYFDRDRLATAFLDIANQFARMQINFGFLVLDGTGVLVAERTVATPSENLPYALNCALEFASFDTKMESYLLSKNDPRAVSSYKLIMSSKKLQSEGFETLAKLQSFGGMELQNEINGGEVMRSIQRGGTEQPNIIYISGMHGDSTDRIVELAARCKASLGVSFCAVNPTAPWVVARTEEEGYDEYIQYLKKLKVLRYASVLYETGDPVSILSKLMAT